MGPACWPRLRQPRPPHPARIRRPRPPEAPPGSAAPPHNPAPRPVIGPCPNGPVPSPPGMIASLSSPSPRRGSRRSAAAMTSSSSHATSAPRHPERASQDLTRKERGHHVLHRTTRVRDDPHAGRDQHRLERTRDRPADEDFPPKRRHLSRPIGQRRRLDDHVGSSDLAVVMRLHDHEASCHVTDGGHSSFMGGDGDAHGSRGSNACAISPPLRFLEKCSA